MQHACSMHKLFYMNDHSQSSRALRVTKAWKNSSCFTRRGYLGSRVLCGGSSIDFYQPKPSALD